MKENIKFFLLTFILSLPFWWGVNTFTQNLNDFLFWREIAENPQILTAQLNQEILEEKLEELKPLKKEAGEPEVNAKAAISIFTNSKGKQKILFEKNGDKILPIASLTKLMTAYIVLENYGLSDIVQVSKEAVDQEGDFGKLKIGEIFTVKNLLYPLLMESSNDVAYALAADYEKMNKDGFVALMNFEAENLGLKNTHFFNPNGLDPLLPEDSKEINYSNGKDLVKFTSFLLEKEPLIWEILGNRELDLYSPDGVYHHKVKNNNELLEKNTGWQTEIIGGKTGWTQRADGCLVLVLKAPKSQGYLINVILGSEDRFLEMEKLVDWVFEAYKW